MCGFIGRVDGDPFETKHFCTAQRGHPGKHSCVIDVKVPSNHDPSKPHPSETRTAKWGDNGIIEEVEHGAVAIKVDSPVKSEPPPDGLDSIAAKVKSARESYAGTLKELRSYLDREIAQLESLK
jgi:hypothetical protein